MLLAPNRPNPPRHRERELHPARELDSHFQYGWDPINEVYTIDLQATNIVPAGYEWMNDDGARVSSGKHRWKDCQHLKSTTTYVAHNWARDYCAAGCLNGGDDPGKHFTTKDWYKPADPINPMQDIISNQYVQAALHRCLCKWHDGLYNFNAAALPDVSVMLMEDLPQLSGSLTSVITIAQKLAKYGRILADLRFELDRRLLKKSNWVQIKHIQEEIQSYGKIYLGYEFAIRQNIASATDLIAGIAGGAYALRYDERQITSHREIAKFHSYANEDLCLGWTGNRDGQSFETVEVHWCITTNSKLTLKGSQLEKTLAKLMAKAGVLPQLASIWEATPYSWLIDYVFRTGLLLRYVERANNLGFADLDIMDLSLSLYIKRVTDRVAGRHYPMCGLTTTTMEYYERCVAPDLNFPPVMEWFKLPHGDQWAKALAFFTSKIQN